MPAWSVPGSHRVRKPRMPWQRTMMSIWVWLSMWPVCRRPVTFGGGSSRVNTGRVSPGRGVDTEKSFSLTQYSAQRASIASYALGRSWGMVKTAFDNWHVAFGQRTFPPAPISEKAWEGLNAKGEVLSVGDF